MADQVPTSGDSLFASTDWGLIEAARGELADGTAGPCPALLRLLVSALCLHPTRRSAG